MLEGESPFFVANQNHNNGERSPLLNDNSTAVIKNQPIQGGELSARRLVDTQKALDSIHQLSASNNIAEDIFDDDKMLLRDYFKAKQAPQYETLYPEY